MDSKDNRNKRKDIELAHHENPISWVIQVLKDCNEFIRWTNENFRIKRLFDVPVSPSVLIAYKAVIRSVNLLGREVHIYLKEYYRDQGYTPPNKKKKKPE